MTRASVQDGVRLVELPCDRKHHLANASKPATLKRRITRRNLTLELAHKFLDEDQQVEKMSSLTSTEAQRHQRRKQNARQQPKSQQVSLKSPARTFITNPCGSLFTSVLKRTGNRMILTHATVSLIVIALAVGTTNVRSQESLGPETNLSPDSSQALPEPDTNLMSQFQLQLQQSQQPKQFEISTPPNKQVELECKLPQLVLAQSNETNSANFYWLFQRLSDHKTKPEQLCLGSRCFNGKRRGIELEFDRGSGAYNLLIRNATYKDNDGIYYCEYQDTQSDASHSTEIQLTILIPPQPPTITPTSQNPPREGQEYQLNCHSYGGNPEPNITWFKGDQLVVPGAGVRLEQSRQNGTTTSTLTWIPTIEDHNATYRCSVSNRAMKIPDSYERDVTLQVEFAPKISVGPYNPLKVIQGDRATLSCQVEAHPPVKGIKWYRDGHHVSNHYNHTILEVKVSDSGLYSCQADNGIAPVVMLSNGGSSNPIIASTSNQASGSSSLFSYFGLTSTANDLASKTLVEARLMLDVQYAPRVHIHESHQQPLQQGDHFVLNCSADSSPPAHEFVWTKQEDDQTVRRISSSPNPTLVFQSIAANDMGNYTCTAYNRLESSGQLQQVYERSGSSSMMVLVRHAPGLGELSVGQNGVTEVGNRTQLRCRATPPGYPEPKYSFWKVIGSERKQLANQVSNPEYTIFSAKAEDEGRYLCAARNEYSSSSDAYAELIVNEAPTIMRTHTWRSSDARSPGISSYTITVQASAKPEPKVTWYHRSPLDGRRIELNSVEMQSKFQIKNTLTPDTLLRSQMQTGKSSSSPRLIVVTTLTFKQKLEVDDRGLYWVEFSNGLSKAAVENYQLNIYHSPIPALRNMPIPKYIGDEDQRAQAKQDTVQTRAGYDLGEQVNLTCRVSAFPQPSAFVWYYQAQGGSAQNLDQNPRYRTSLSNPYDNIHEHTLSFTLMSDEDYGDYMCTTANYDSQTLKTSPSTNIVFHLGHKSAPEAPLQLEQVDATQDSVTVQWQPGFDGGFSSNQFIVQYAPDDGSGATLMHRYGPPTEQQLSQSSFSAVEQSLGLGDQQQFPRHFDCSTMDPCTIGSLQPRQAYLMRIRAKNDLGSSEFSDELRVSTRANNTQIPIIQEASFDPSRNMLRYRVERSPEYLLNSLEIHVDVKGGNTNTNGNNALPSTSPDSDHYRLNERPSSEWRRHLTMPLHRDQGEVFMNMMPDVELLKLTLCSRSNESLCGEEFIVGTQSSALPFLQVQRSLSMSIFVVLSFLLVIIIVTATTLHSRCLSRKARKAAALDHPDHTNSNGHRHLDGKQPNPLVGHINAGLNLNGGGNIKIGSNSGSTASTNSTSGGTNSGPNGQLQSLDSINHATGQHLLNNGSNSDHSSDHSRQAKLDSMLPPNYSHYADRASLMLEQQQQQQQQQHQQQQQQHQAYLSDKLGSPFGLPTSSLLTSADPNGQLMGDYFGGGGYGQSGAAMSPLEHRQMLEATGAASQHPMMMGSMLGYEPNEGQQMYATHQALVDDYSYNNAHLTSYPNQEQLMESAYGTTGAVMANQDHQANASGLMMAQTTQASFDNNANQTFLGYPNGMVVGGGAYDDQQQQSQYQHELAAAQQQMYGTLTRASNNNAGSQQPNSSPSQSQTQQQYLGSTGLMPPPPPPPQESDYGTTGGARSGGRLIREIIV